jgi:hypothetical protein
MSRNKTIGTGGCLEIESLFRAFDYSGKLLGGRAPCGRNRIEGPELTQPS